MGVHLEINESESLQVSAIFTLLQAVSSIPEVVHSLILSDSERGQAWIIGEVEDSERGAPTIGILGLNCRTSRNSDQNDLIIEHSSSDD